MSKIVIDIEAPTGDVYSVRSELLSRSLFNYIDREKPKTLDDASEMIAAIAGKINAEWTTDGKEWHKDGWDDLAPVVTTSWLNKLVQVSGVRVEAKVRAEKN